MNYHFKTGNKMEIVIATNESFVYIQVICPDETSLSWEQLQQIKDKYYPEKDFIEVYPKKSQIINKANVRHLIHLRNFECPKLEDFETECNIEIHQLKPKQFEEWLLQFKYSIESDCYWYNEKTLYCIEAMKDKYKQYIRNYNNHLKGK